MILPNIVNLLSSWDLDFFSGGTWSSLTRGNQLVILNSIHPYFFLKIHNIEFAKDLKVVAAIKHPDKKISDLWPPFYQFVPQRQKWSLPCLRPVEWTKWDNFLSVPLSPSDRSTAFIINFQGLQKKIAIFSPGDHRGHPLASDRGILLSSRGLSYCQIPLWKVGRVVCFLRGVDVPVVCFLRSFEVFVSVFIDIL